MSLSKIRFSYVALFLVAFFAAQLLPAWAQHGDAGNHADDHKTGSIAQETVKSNQDLTGHKAETATDSHGEHGKQAHGDGAHGDGHGDGHGEGHHEPKTFDPHYGTWVNPLARLLWGAGPVEVSESGGVKHYSNIQYDFSTLALVTMAFIGILGVLAARRMALRPAGKPMSLSNMVEAAADGFQNYLVGVMGPHLALKYAPLIASFFFTILFFNWMGLVPGMMAPTANPNIPIALALVAFVCTHLIAIREAGVKSWFMHFVGEPVWLAPLNFPLHLVGELIKPLSLSIRLLCNVFGEEMVAFQLIGLAVATMALLPIPLPFHLPMLLLGSFFALLQALVFSTLLAIYISVLSTHHDEHDEHNNHGSVEHVRTHGFDEVVAHPSQSPVA